MFNLSYHIISQIKIYYIYHIILSHIILYYVVKGSLEVKLPTIWTFGKAEVGRAREERRTREKIREEKESEERRCMCAKGRKVAIHYVFPMLVAPDGRKVGSLKQRVRSHLAR